jgi:hypothetical protein
LLSLISDLTLGFTTIAAKWKEDDAAAVA